MPNEWGSGVYALLGAVIGGLVSIVSTIAVNEWGRWKSSKSVAYALRAEVASILENAERRNYAEHFRAFSTAWRRGEMLDATPNIPGITDELEPVVKAHIGKLGELKSDDAADIVLFHNRLRQINGGIKSLNEGAWPRIEDKIQLVEDELDLWEETLELGKSLVRRLAY